MAVFWSPLRKFIVKECYHPCPVSKQPLHSYLQKAVPLLSGLLYWGRDITTPLHSMKEYTLLSSARQSQNYIHCCILRSFYLPFRCYAGIYQSSCHIVYKPDWIRTLKWNGLVVRVVVSCIRSTSNHNALTKFTSLPKLFPVSVLHQTTTLWWLFLSWWCCFLYPFYIKPQRTAIKLPEGISCFLYPFYIKPQHYPSVAELWCVVSCIRSTSNHNPRVYCRTRDRLFPVSGLHQTTTIAYKD